MEKNLYHLIVALDERNPGDFETLDFNEETERLVVVKLRLFKYHVMHYKRVFMRYNELENIKKFEYNLVSSFIYSLK